MSQAGMSRADLTDIGETPQSSAAGLTVVGRWRLQEALQATKHAVMQFEKQLNIELQAFDKGLTEAVKQALKEAQGKP